VAKNGIDFLVRYLHLKGEIAKVEGDVRRGHPDVDSLASECIVDALAYWIHIDFPYGKLFPYDLILVHSLDTNQWSTAGADPANVAWSIVCLDKVKVGSDTPEGKIAESIQGIEPAILEMGKRAGFLHLRFPFDGPGNWVIYPKDVSGDPRLTVAGMKNEHTAEFLKTVRACPTPNRMLFFTKQVWNSFPPEDRKPIIDAMDLDDPVERVKAVLTGWTTSLTGFYRTLETGVSGIDVGLDLALEMEVIRRGGIYRVDKDLFPHLLATRCNILWDHFKMPQQGMLIDFGATGLSLPADFAQMKMHWRGDPAFKVRPDDVYEFRGVRAVDIKDHLHITFFGFEQKTGEELYRSFIIPIQMGRHISDTLREEEKKWRAAVPFELFSLLFTTILYVTSEGFRGEVVDEEKPIREELKRLKNPAKVKKAKEKLKTAIRYTVISSRKKLPHISYERGRLVTEAVRTINMVVSVCGHFKNQPYGPLGELRKNIWIEPYIRGKEFEGVESKDEPKRFTVKK
jgi:hypothetical protein